MRTLLLLLGLVAFGACTPTSPSTHTSATPEKPRVVVTTDPELDDSNSLVRYLLYSTDVQTEGLIYASSQYHWKGDGQGTTWSVPDREYKRFGLDLCPCTSWRWAEDERFIHDAVDIYAQVYDNLIVHHPDYPAPDTLRSKIRFGNVAFDGDISEDSPGSDLIKRLLLDVNDAPVYLLAWGGQSTIARALKSIQEQHENTPQWPTLHDRISQKAIIHSFADQDDTYATYIQPNWPEIQLRDRTNGTYGYGARRVVLPEDQIYLSAAWTAQHVTSQGPFGAFYRVWGDGKQMVEGDIFDYFGYAGLTDDELRAQGYIVWMPSQEPGSWVSEGDTPTFLSLIDNGLRGYQDATYGGWGGRDGMDNGPDGPDENYAMARFFGTAQRDFAARLAWSVTPTYTAVNHEPVVTIDGPLARTARPGETISLQGAAEDPDGDSITVRWWSYDEVGSYPNPITLSGTPGPTISLTVPKDAAAGHTIHIILEATDNGMPALTRYQRVIITVGA